MIISLFSKALKIPQILSQPLVQANKLFAAKVDEVVLFQVNALKSYLDITVNQMKAAAEISDLKSLQDFYKRQTEIAQTVQQKFLSDARIVSSMYNHFQVEMDHLAKATLDDILPKAT